VSPARDAIIEIAIAKMRGPEIIAEYQSYLNPGVPIPREITELTGISDADVADAPSFSEVAADILEFIGDCDILAHNAAFDKGFVEAALAQATVGDLFSGGVRPSLPGAWIDSIVFLRLGLPLLKSFKLEDMMRAFSPDDYAQAHRALADVRGLCSMWRIALVGMSKLDKSVLRSLPGMFKTAPEQRWIATVADLYAGSTGSTTLRLKALRQTSIKGQPAEDLLDARTKAEVRLPSVEAIEQDLSEAGLAGHMYASFESRPEQLQMAVAIRDSFEGRKHLAVEAGTGVGKSLAYLVCLARLALENQLNVGVATKTNALTDQLIGKELPLLAAQLPGLRYAALKGYSHYPCLRKVNALLQDPDDDFVRRNKLALAQLLCWISQTSWAELSSANLPLNYTDKRVCAASSADCMRRRCTYYHQCYVHGARKIAKSAHIVVTNHSLLFRNSAAEGKILPPIRYWAVDEAHNLEAEARKQLSLSFDERELGLALRQLAGSRGLVKRLLLEAPSHMSAAELQKHEETAGEIQKLLQSMDTLSDNFFAYAQDLDGHKSLKENSPYASSYQAGTAAKTHWIGPELRESSAWGALCSVGTNLLQELQALIGLCKDQLRSYADSSDEKTPPAELSDLAGVVAILGDLAQALTLAINEPEENFVYSLYLSRAYQGKRTAAFEIAQLEVGEKVADELLDRAESVIFTSATLAVGQSFSRFSSGVGLDTLEPEIWSTLQLQSSYDLESLMRIFVPTDMPAPPERGWSSQLISLLRQVHLASKGGVLTLFTSRRDLLNCRDVLQDDLRPEGIDVLAQDGMLTMRVLQERFIADYQASLLATKSFWEGFDASGDTLRCIVIPKLPFGSPNTPLARERNHVYGRGAWARYDLPEAILELKQAVGRLVRSSTDSGVVVLADSRVLTKNYGSRVLDALPVSAMAMSTADIVKEIEVFNGS